jgi:hypothetical protein
MLQNHDIQEKQTALLEKQCVKTPAVLIRGKEKAQSPSPKLQSEIDPRNIIENDGYTAGMKDSLNQSDITGTTTGCQATIASITPINKVSKTKYTPICYMLEAISPPKVVPPVVNAAPQTYMTDKSEPDVTTYHAAIEHISLSPSTQPHTIPLTAWQPSESLHMLSLNYRSRCPYYGGYFQHISPI